MTQNFYSLEKESLRIKNLRNSLVKIIPKIPNNRDTKDELEKMDLHGLFLTYLTWRQRFVPPRPRVVKLWGSDAEKLELKALDYILQPFFKKVLEGDDLTSHLSNDVHRIGYKSEKFKTDVSYKNWDERDFMLTAYGIYHFHLGTSTPKNPTGRSGNLILAEVTSNDFTVIYLSNHQVFDNSSEERQKFYEISRSYIQRDMLPGVVYLNNPITTSGHSTAISIFSGRCARMLYDIDRRLDNIDYTRFLFSHTKLPSPSNPNYKWIFCDMTLGIFESKSCLLFIVNEWSR